MEIGDNLMHKTTHEDCQRELANAILQIKNKLTEIQSAVGVLETFLYLSRKEYEGVIKDLTPKVPTEE